MWLVGRLEAFSHTARGVGIRVWGLQGYLTYTKLPPSGPYSKTMPRVLGDSQGGWAFSQRYLYRGYSKLRTHTAPRKVLGS